MSAEEPTAVTGRPMAEYEKYVELIAQVMANALALATDREFLLSLDRTAPLEEALHDHARNAIQWRFAFRIDEIENRDRAVLAHFINLGGESKGSYALEVDMTARAICDRCAAGKHSHDTYTGARRGEDAGCPFAVDGVSVPRSATKEQHQAEDLAAWITTNLGIQLLPWQREFLKRWERR